MSSKTDVLNQIFNQLTKLQDLSYADFQSRLVPGISKDMFIGVRVPLLRKYSKELYNDSNHYLFLADLPHRYYDENMLHGLLIEQIKDYEKCIEAINIFLPFIDNWAVCDVISPKVFFLHKSSLIISIRKWISSNHTYTVRFGIEMLMRYFLDDDFLDEYLELVANVNLDEYYVKMMQAWFYATALSKQWSKTIVYLENDRLNSWVHNKTIQKAIESFRISPSNKTYVKSLRRK